MTKVKCFKCGKNLKIDSVTMEEILNQEEVLPMFCSLDCSGSFPSIMSEEFKKEIEKLRGKYNGRIRKR